jgi:hypothetical protein
MPGTQDATAVWGPKIASFLMSDINVARLDFPSLAALRRPYSGMDYVHMGHVIAGGRIEIATEFGGSMGRALMSYRRIGNSQINVNSKYCHPGLLRPGFTSKDPKARTQDDVARLQTAAVLVHEITHMIQDWKRMWMSPLEREVDAYFAKALYLVRVGADDLWPNGFANHAMIAAKFYHEDSGYLRSSAFRRMHAEVSKEIREFYTGKVDYKLDPRSRGDGLNL